MIGSVRQSSCLQLQQIFFRKVDYLQEKGMIKMIIRTGWLSGIEERCLLSRLSWIFCVTLLLRIYESSCVVGETSECRNSHYKEKPWARSAGDSRSQLGATLPTAERALPWSSLRWEAFAGSRGLSQWKVVRHNQLLCTSGGGVLLKYDCCDRHNQCLDSVGNLQILQLSEHTLCAAQPLVVI